MADSAVIGILVSGRGSNMEAILRAVAAGTLQARVGLVISSRADAPALEIAARYGVATSVIVPKAYDSRAEAGAAIIAALREAGVTVVALAGYKPILDPGVVAAYPNAILNVHPSLLPAFAGGMAPRPQADALAAGVKLSGCTVHFVTDDVDAGPIIAQAAVPVYDDDTVESLSDRILEQEHRLLPEALALVAAGRIVVVDGKHTRILPMREEA
ncbi:MAG TPA: phosphoribosylglycinamide formyltransferase [Ktedonobacterales bacterium]|nr:phosphoribosylglycinamide formyltransferase [Ktedonobacterales bacterium]